MSDQVTQDFGALVAKLVLTCHACPTQYEGQLRDGRQFYFRYRSGWASLGVGDTPEEAVSDPREVAIQRGGQYDGSLTHKEFVALFIELMRERSEVPL